MMLRRRLSLGLSALLAAASATAQTPARQQQPRQTPPPQQQTPTGAQQPAPTPPTESDEDVVRITTNLVQFDAVVTDKHGQLVTDLRPEDFDVRVDGRAQQITNLSFVSNEAGTVSSRPAAARPADKGAPPAPPVPLREGQVRRTIALVVDDLGTSFEDMPFVKRALKKFVDEQMQPGDLIAVIRTSAGVGALQQFTTDKQLLYRAIERVRWYPLGRAGVSAFEPFQADPLAGAGASKPGSGDDDEGGANGGQDAGADLDSLREQMFAVGSLGALNFIIRGMRELPGRKSLVVFSDGFKVFNKGDVSQTQRILEELRRLADRANRASVVIYTLDARGLPALGLTAADEVSSGGNPQRMTEQINNLLNSRRSDYFDTQTGLNYLAQQTGGLFLHDTNDLGGSVRRVLEDQKGYYLIGFRPDERFFDPANGRQRFNHFDVKVRRAGLRVRTRAGFYGYAEGDAKPAPRTRAEQMLTAIASPLRSGELSLRLTSLFDSPGQKVEAVDSLMHIDISQFKFTDEADGWKKAVIDVMALTFGEDGQVVDQINRTETVRARGDGLSYILNNGVIYVMKVPLKKPGAYQLRVAVRDAQTEKLGTASQFIEVPDLKKDRLALSGIVLTLAPDASAKGARGAVGAGAAEAQQQPSVAEGQAADESNALRNAAVRRFRQGAKVDFFYSIYNARVERGSARTQLQTQVRLFHEGRAVFNGPAQTYDPAKQTDTARLQSAGRLQLGASLQPGEYVLQIVVTDALAKGKYKTATQWIDFEIVK